jgi:hypothetical protein
MIYPTWLWSYLYYPYDRPFDIEMNNEVHFDYVCDVFLDAYYYPVLFKRKAAGPALN